VIWFVLAARQAAEDGAAEGLRPVLGLDPQAGTARAMLSSMAGAQGFGGSFAQPLLIGAAAIVSMLGPSTYTSVTRYLGPSPALAALTATAALYVLLQVGAGQPQSFIYFQF
jgi:alginate O-acetyltransferase complex protein AlgI